MGTLQGILGTVVLFGVAILVHEFGHFLFAKLSGVGVEVFSIGFGKKIFSIKRGETTYAISAIPVGGYVKLISGEPEGESSDGEQTEESKEKKSVAESVHEEQMALKGKSLFTKIAILAAGCCFNLIIAFVVFFLLGVIGFSEYAPFTNEVFIVEADSVAEKIGLLPGDVVVNVDNENVSFWHEVMGGIYKAVEQKKETVPLAVERDDVVRTIDLDTGAMAEEDVYNFGAAPFRPAAIGGVIPNDPADKAGFREGDLVLEIDGEPVGSWYDLVDIVRVKPAIPLLFKIEREEEVISLTVTPELNPDSNRATIGVIVGNTKTTQIKLSAMESFERSYSQIWLLIRVNAIFLKDVCTGQISILRLRKNIGGPVAIGVIAFQTAKKGSYYFRFFAILNVILAFFNLLPIPLLDGGHIMFAVIEKVIGRPIPPRILEKVFFCTFVILVTLLVLVTFNDLLRNAWRFKALF